jgi:hypothetical protein
MSSPHCVRSMNFGLGGPPGKSPTCIHDQHTVELMTAMERVEEGSRDGPDLGGTLAEIGPFWIRGGKAVRLCTIDLSGSTTMARQGNIPVGTVDHTCLSISPDGKRLQTPGISCSHQLLPDA